MHKENNFYEQTHMGEFQNEFQETYLNREELKKGGDGRIRDQKHLKHGEMEETFMNFVSATAARDAAFTELFFSSGHRN